MRLVAGNSKGADDKPCALVIENKMLMAERVGFEPTVELPPTPVFETDLPLPPKTHKLVIANISNILEPSKLSPSF